MPCIGLIPEVAPLKLFLDLRLSGLWEIMLHLRRVLLGCFRGK